MRRFTAGTLLLTAASIIMAVVLGPFLIAARFWPVKISEKPRLFFGATPILSLALIAAAMRQAGYRVTAGAVADVGFAQPDGFDLWVRATGSTNMLVRRTLGTLEAMAAFVRVLFSADIFNLYFDGGLLRRTPLQEWEVKLLKFAGKRVVLFPYGSDAFVIDKIPYSHWRDMLAADYPQFLGRARSIERRLARFSEDADMVIGCLVHIATLPKWDALMLVCYPVETHELVPDYPDPGEPVMRVFHAPNHRNFKGTDAIIAAVETLKDEGVAIELDLVERVPRAEVLARMAKAHVLVDQLNAGYAQTALEGMALGKIVITGKNPPQHDCEFLGSTALADCPIHWASPQSIADVLRDIAKARDQWREWGKANRRFVERHHSYAATADAWEAVFARLGGASVDQAGTDESDSGRGGGSGAGVDDAGVGDASSGQGDDQSKQQSQAAQAGGRRAANEPHEP